MRYYEIENEMYRRAVELIEKRYPVGWGGAGVVHTSNGNYYTSVSIETANASAIVCIELEDTNEQCRYINPNIFSLAEAYVHSDANKADAEKFYRCIPFAIYHGDDMVAFAQVTYEKEYDFDGKLAYELYKVMIDKKHQGKGFGKEAACLLLNYIKDFPYGEVENVFRRKQQSGIKLTKKSQKSRKRKACMRNYKIIKEMNLHGSHNLRG